MLIRLILSPADEHRSGANQMGQHLSFREHFRRGNAASSRLPRYMLPSNTADKTTLRGFSSASMMAANYRHIGGRENRLGPALQPIFAVSAHDLHCRSITCSEKIAEREVKSAKLGSCRGQRGSSCSAENYPRRAVSLM
jgi:hypothetical protein